MDPQPGASFIPKKPLISGVQRSSGGFGGLLLLVSLVLFIGSIVLAGVVFAYQQYLGGLIASRSNSLTLAQEAYDPAVLQNLIRLDSRIKNAQNVMKSHVAPSAVFTFLENATLQKVRFTSFDYQAGGNGNASLTLAGEAPDFATVALQSDTFGGSRVLKDILFSDLIVSDSGKVGFTVHAAVDPSFILYSNFLAAELAAAQSAPPSSSGAMSTTP